MSDQRGNTGRTNNGYGHGYGRPQGQYNHSTQGPYARTSQGQYSNQNQRPNSPYGSPNDYNYQGPNGANGGYGAPNPNLGNNGGGGMGVNPSLGPESGADNRFTILPNPWREYEIVKRSERSGFWHVMLVIGSAITFARNLFFNLIFLLMLFFLLGGYVLISNLMEGNISYKTVDIDEINKNALQAEVLYFDLEGSISEIPFANTKIDSLQRELEYSLYGRNSHEVVAIENALRLVADDKNIKKVIIDIDGMGPITLSVAARLGKAMEQAKKPAGDNMREIVVVGTAYTQAAYALAAHADRIILDPLGEVSFRGISMSTLFFKDLLDKADVTPYIFRAGHFKSAVEPFMLNAMSPDVKREYQAIAFKSWDIYKKEISSRPQLKSPEVLPDANTYVNWIRQFKGNRAKMQMAQGVVDEVIPLEQYYTRITSEVNADADNPYRPAVITYQDYLMRYHYRSGNSGEVRALSQINIPQKADLQSLAVIKLQAGDQSFGPYGNNSFKLGDSSKDANKPNSIDNIYSAAIKAQDDSNLYVAKPLDSPITEEEQFDLADRVNMPSYQAQEQKQSAATPDAPDAADAAIAATAATASTVAASAATASTATASAATASTVAASAAVANAANDNVTKVTSTASLDTTKGAAESTTTTTVVNSNKNPVQVLASNSSQVASSFASAFGGGESQSPTTAPSPLVPQPQLMAQSEADTGSKGTEKQRNRARQLIGDLPQVAVIYGVGEISDISERPTDFTYDNIVPLIEQAQFDKNVVATVLYLNSPGGSVIASERIRRALEQYQASGKPLIISMNGTAASGAYWIASQGDAIYATPSTITGSIGVFGIGFGVHKLLNRFGAYQDGVVTNELALQAIARELPQSQQELLNMSVEKTYQDFVELVAKNRGLKPNEYHIYAEGQIFLAEEARSIGLVDEIGDLDAAIAAAANAARRNVEDITVNHMAPGSAYELTGLESLLFGMSTSFMPQEFTYALVEWKKHSKLIDPDSPQNILAISPIGEPKL